MTLPNLFSQLGWLALLFPAIGLALSFRFRTRPWVVFVWMPAALFLAYTSFWACSKMAAFGHIRGPDAIGVGIAMLFLGGMLGASLVGLVLCYFARPKREAWKLATALPAAALCVGLSVLVCSPQGSLLAGRITRLHFIVSDVEGKPLPGVAVKVVVYEEGVGAGGGGQTTGTDGQFMVQLRESQSARIELRHPFPPSNVLSAMPTFWDLNVQMPRQGEHDVVIRHSWQRSLGGHTFNEAFSERVPEANNLDLRVVLPTHSGLGGRLLREKVHAALASIQDPARQQMGYDYVCRNLEAVEYLPWLIETYRNNPGSRPSLARGLGQVAGLLSELDTACGHLEEVAAHPRQHNKDYLDGEFAYEVAQLTAWAGVNVPDHELALARARAVIADRAKILAEFLMAEAPSNETVVGAYGELGRLGLPYLPAFFALLREHPPQKERTCQTWGHSLWMVVAREDKLEKLRPLFDSRDPACTLIACEAMGNQVDLVGPMILKSMQEVCAEAPDSEVRRRLSWRINGIKEDLARDAVLSERAKKP